MELAYKPDFEEARQRWDAFWEGEIIGRPCAAIRAPKEGVPLVEPCPYLDGWDGDFDDALARYEEWAAATYFGGEAMPYFVPSFGPDQFAAFVGAKLERSAESRSTTWAVPFVQDWDEVLPFRLDSQNPWWRKMLDFLRQIAQVGEGKFLAGMIDLHSNFDALVGVRGAQQLCLDLMDQPETVQRAMQSAREIHPLVYEAVFEAGNMAKWGSLGWLPFYSRGRYVTTQCDFVGLISPQIFDRFVLPALAEESALVDHSVYHLDGRDALPHLDSLLGIEQLDGIQWVPGSGSPPLIEWIDLLRTIQNAGKCLDIYCSAEEVKVFHRELKPTKAFYRVSTETEREARDLLKWLEQNT